MNHPQTPSKDGSWSDFQGLCGSSPWKTPIIRRLLSTILSQRLSLLSTILTIPTSTFGKRVWKKFLTTIPTHLYYQLGMIFKHQALPPAAPRCCVSSAAEPSSAQRPQALCTAPWRSRRCYPWVRRWLRVGASFRSRWPRGDLGMQLVESSLMNGYVAI